MKWSKAIFLSILIALLLVAVPLMGSSVAKSPTPTVTLKPLVTISPLPVSFSGGIGSISGTVSDGKGNGIPNAKVTLYYAAWIGNDYKAKDPVRLEGITNPQYTSDGSMSPAGLYVFTNIPPAVYVLTAEMGGVSVSKNIMVTGGTTTENLIIQQYVDDTPTPTPPAPTSAPTSTPRPTVKPTTVPPVNTAGPDFVAILFDVLKAVLIGVVCFQFLVGIVFIAMRAGRKH